MEPSGRGVLESPAYRYYWTQPQSMRYSPPFRALVDSLIAAQ